MKKLILKKGFIFQKLGRKTVIFDGEKSVLYTFNETASFIFQKLKQNLPQKIIARELANKYKISIKKALNDVEQFVTELVDNKIVLTEK